jgi:hypothetical protein
MGACQHGVDPRTFKVQVYGIVLCVFWWGVCS